jgi:hypothetical protein
MAWWGEKQSTKEKNGGGKKKGEVERKENVVYIFMLCGQHHGRVGGGIAKKLCALDVVLLRGNKAASRVQKQ